MATATDKRCQVELAIERMTCTSRAARLEKQLNRPDGVSASVNFASEQAAVTFDPHELSVEDVRRTVEATGYHASLPQEALGEEDPARPYRLRLRVALTTPVVFWCAWPFHRAAVLNARHMVATMGTLISLGTLAARGFSTVDLLAGIDEHTYFETAAVITALILLGRYFETRAKRRLRLRHFQPRRD